MEGFISPVKQKLLQSLLDMLESSLVSLGSDIITKMVTEVEDMTDDDAQAHILKVLKNPYVLIAEEAKNTIPEYEKFRNDPRTQAKAEELVKLIDENSTMEEIQMLIEDKSEDDDGSSGTKH